MAPATEATMYDVAASSPSVGEGYTFGGLPFVRPMSRPPLNFLAGPLAGLITEAACPDIVNTWAMQTG